MTSEWVEKEMAGLSLGDKRLNKRAKFVLSTFGEKPGQLFPQQFESAGELKGCYRLFDSDRVSSEALLKPHYQRIIERARNQDVVLVASDSSSANYTTRLTHPDTGYISSNNAQGFLVHVSLATTLKRLPLGIVAAKFWAREKKKPEKKVHRDLLPIEEKESFKWLESYRAAQELADEIADTQVINVADREADILELWKEALANESKKNPAHLIVRSNHNRAIAPTDTNPHKKLFDFVSSTPQVGESTFQLIDRKTQKAKRVVTQEVRATSVIIRPAKRAGMECSKFKLNVVFLKEVGAPEGEKPVSWILLTTLPIETAADIEKIIQSYLARWDIEILFRTFKSGCKVEERSLRTADRIYPMFMLFFIISWRINNFTRLARSDPDLPCSVLFSEFEWKAAVAAITKNLTSDQKVPSIREMLIMVAKLGGYLNRNSDPEPGPTVIWRGLEYLRAFTDAFQLFSLQRNT